MDKKKLFKIELLFIAILMQLFFNIFSNAFNLGNYMFAKSFGFPAELIIIINILCSILSIYLLFSIITFSKQEKELYILQNEKMHNDNLTAFLRELKHDINNQIFVINGLLNLGNPERASEYAKDLNLQFDWMQQLLEMNQPEIASLILNKIMLAKNQDICVEVDVKVTNLPPVASQVYIRTISNLLDNAIEAMQSTSLESKKLIVKIYSSNDALIVRVGNTGEIPDAISYEMFRRGFSTKEGNEVHGLGLHIVSSIMGSIGGRITHHNSEGMTYFELNYPM